MHQCTTAQAYKKHTHTQTHWNLKGKDHFKIYPPNRLLSILLPLSCSVCFFVSVSLGTNQTDFTPDDFQWWHALNAVSLLTAETKWMRHIDTHILTWGNTLNHTCSHRQYNTGSQDVEGFGAALTFKSTLIIDFHFFVQAFRLPTVIIRVK